MTKPTSGSSLVNLPVYLYPFLVLHEACYLRKDFRKDPLYRYQLYQACQFELMLISVENLVSILSNHCCFDYSFSHCYSSSVQPKDLPVAGMGSELALTRIVQTH